MHFLHRCSSSSVCCFVGEGNFYSVSSLHRLLIEVPFLDQFQMSVADKHGIEIIYKLFGLGHWRIAGFSSDP
ncbi:hypothetical protein AKJ16_DCAP09342 [Drosera capensis]